MQHVFFDDGSTERKQERRRLNEAEADGTRGHNPAIQEDRYLYDKPPSNISVSGHGSIWQGDHYGLQTNYYYQEAPQSSKKEKCQLLESLTFVRMDARLRNIATALPNTCQWLQYHERFLVWIDMNRIYEHGGFLWIKGKPGSGKSTIMKAIVAWAEREWSPQIVLTYFFNARSPNALEKSSLGLYQSLVYQLLEAYPDAQPFFIARFALKERQGKIIEEWAETELQNFLIELITTRIQRLVTVFIDALDEGSSDDVRRLTSYLERLTQHSISIGAGFRVCLASRHYPHVTVRQGLSIVLEDQPEQIRDIDFYIGNQMRGDDSRQTDKLHRRVRDRSAGVFLWVVLVIATLNELFDQGKSLTSMLRKLNETSQDLDRLFANIFSQDQDDIGNRVTLLRWVYFALRPLHPIELYVAMQIRSSLYVSDSVPVGGRLTRYLLNCSRGLVEVTRAEPATVQFIHETVRDFLVRKNILKAHLSAESESLVGLSDYQDDNYHVVMAIQCIQYLITPGREASSTSAGQRPLARYAAEYWWQHIQISSHVCSPGLLARVQDLLMNQANLHTWVRRYNMDWPWRKYDRSLTLADLPPPLYYASLIGRSEIVILLLEGGADVNAQGGLHGNALQAASRRGYDNVVQILLNHGADVNARGEDYNNAMQVASREGYDGIVQMLLDRGADINAQGGRYGSALQAAAVGGHEKIVQMLLDRGAGVNAQGGRYGSALKAAAAGGHEKIVQMLLDGGADVNAQSGVYNSALKAASYKGNEKVVQILLEYGADVNAQGGDYSNALEAASVRGHEAVVQMLLDTGADVNAQGGVYNNALHAASHRCHGKVVQILLKRGAKDV